MFVFLDTATDTVIATDAWTRENYRHAKSDYPDGSCLGCGEHVIFSMVRKTDAYFAKHESNAECSFDSNESREHQRMKLEIERSLLEAGWEARAEWYRVGPDGDAHIADVSATRGGRTVAFEVQLSPQSAEETVRRQVQRLGAGIDECWWIFGKRSWNSNRALAELGFPASTSAPNDTAPEHSWPPPPPLATLIEHDRDLGSWAVDIAELSINPASAWGRLAQVVSSRGPFTLDDLAHLATLNRDINEGVGAVQAEAAVAVRGTGARTLDDSGIIVPTLQVGVNAIFEGCPRCGAHLPAQLTTAPDVIGNVRILSETEDVLGCSETETITLQLGPGTVHECRPSQQEEWRTAFPKSDDRALIARVARACDDAGVPREWGEGRRSLLAAGTEFRLPARRRRLVAGATQERSVLVFGHDSPEHSEVESEKLEAAGVPLLSILDRSGRSSLAAPFRHVGDAVTSLISAQSLSSNDSEWTGAWAAARGSTTGTRVRPSIAAAVCGPMRFENGSWMTAHLGRIEVVCECGQMWNVHTNTDVATQRCGYKNCLGGQETVRLEHGGGLTEDEIAAVLGSGELATNNLGEFSCDCGRTLAAIDYEYPDSNAPQGMSLRARPQRRVTGGRTHSCSAHLDRKSPLRRGGADSAAFGYPA